MPASQARRPLPALIALIALLLLTSLVWWRVLHRGRAAPAATPCPTQASQAVLPAPQQVTVTVLNATNRTGIAARARTALVTDGFTIPSPAANDRSKKRIAAVAEIRFGPKGRKGATLLQYYFPGARMVANNTTSAVVVVALGEKYRSVASSSSVDAALQRQRISTASPSPSASC